MYLSLMGNCISPCPLLQFRAALSPLSYYQKLANSYDFIFPDAREHSPEIWHRETYREGKHWKKKLWFVSVS
jgi:hypothetical protein